MPRWEPNAPDRLARAALELFAERGYDETTVPEIAERAGLTTRSFFRHFADKREVLFLGGEEIPIKIADLISSAPPGLSLMDLLVWGVELIAREFFEGNREELAIRRTIIEATPALKERELHKQADFAAAIAQTLEAAGRDPLEALVAAKISVTISSTSIARWLDADDDRALVDHVRETCATVTHVVTDGPPPRPSS